MTHHSSQSTSLTSSPLFCLCLLSPTLLPCVSEFRHGEGAVLVDGVSLSLLKGSVIDYRVRLERSGFEVLDNPNSVAKCGCGSSFQPKHL
jgi:Fe-S cluster assembly iron-binding protein IscA